MMKKIKPDNSKNHLPFDYVAKTAVLLRAGIGGIYDGDGKRVQSTVGGVTTTFVGSHYEVTGSTVTKYYFAGTSRVAMRKYTIPQSMSVEYLLGDHLGSTSITTDTTGAKVSEMRYKPWGEVRYSWTAGLSTTPAYKLNSYTFTGQYSDSYINLLWYGSRHYDPELGRFIQPDSIVPSATQGVQAYDRYAYTNNNPVRYTDPSGHCLTDPFTFFVCAMVAGAIIDGGINAYSQYKETGHIDGGEVFNHAVEGALIGGGVVIAATAATALLPAATVAGAAACADGDCTNEAIAAEESVSNAIQGVAERPDLYRFGNSPNGPNGFGVNPKPSDFPYLNGNTQGIVGPESPPIPNGLSTFASIEQSGLSGHYYVLPGSAQLPNSLSVIADGKDVLVNSPLAETHHTIFPNAAMIYNEWSTLINDLPWKYIGNYKK